MGLDERIGTEFLSPGLGYGGSCFPKDVASLYYQCDEAGVVGAGLLEEVEIQNKMAVQRARDTVRGVPFPARRIAVLGRAFKPGTSDTRDSQAVRLADELMADGYDVVVHDPEADPGPYESAPSVMNAVFGADLVVIATAWPEYLKVNWLLAAAYMNRCWMYDPWNFIGPETARDAGMHYIGTGGHE
jgi:UDPglucose 6-dehydrogenase